ncbi:MAG: 3-oxoacyl-ACP reductase [Chloroflexi bacterium]|nr:MAG: 3-oxoacyl-ACP reductase [Chloroflexota bacterium]
MKEFKGKVAVVTGAASGIGRAMAEKFAAEGMKVVLADIEEGALAKAEREMKESGATVLAVRTDVSKGAAVDALADKAFEAFGGVHVLCNNAGVAPVTGASWELTEADWQWVLGVNLWGALHGVRAFVSRMIEQDSEGHIVNTASVAGLLSLPWGSPYCVGKHGIVTLSESMHGELAHLGSKLKVSVLCPAWVKTELMDSDRNRPAELQNKDQATSTRPQAAVTEQAVRALVAGGTAASGIADLVADAIREERFYVLPHQEWKEQVRTRMEGILNETNPSTEPAIQPAE